ncbi:PAS domain S-box protein [Sphingomonas sp. UYEF23]|uniref:PAS domain S-box protein n=1 Tax=Sphingomonas sp. UYEF23 TaxID=1756408 RepID=UPI003390ACEB
MRQTAFLVRHARPNQLEAFVRLIPGLAAMAVLFGILALLGIELTRGTGRIAALWLPNAVLAGVLLRRQERGARAYLATCFVANMIANLIVGDTVSLAVALAAANSIEVAILVWTMRKLCGPSPEIEEISSLGCLLLICLIAPFAAATLDAVVLASPGKYFDLSVWLTKMLADGLSLLIVTPLIMIAVHEWRNRARPTRQCLLEWLAFLTLATIAATLIFAQSRFPFLFLACPIVILAAFRKGVAGTAAAIAIICIVASGFTMAGIGPITLVKGGSGDQLVALQLFLAVSFAMGLPVASTLATREALRRELKDSRDFAQSILDNVGEVIFKTDAKGRWTFLNPAWELLTGYPVEQSLGWATTRLLHADDLEAAAETYPKIVSGEIDACTLRQRFSTAADDCRHIEVVIRRLATEDGRFLGTTGNIRDVTSSVVQQEALLASERMHRLLADHSSDMIVRIGLDGIRRYVSPACLSLLGYSPEEMIGGAPVAAIHVEDRVRVMDVCRTLLVGVISPVCTYRQQHRDGHYVWLEAAYRLVRNEAGDPIEFVASVRDVSQRRAVELEAAEASARLQENNRLFEMTSALAQVGHWRVDLARNQAIWSDEVCRIHGVELGFSPALENAIYAYHPDDRERVGALVARAIETGESFEFTATLLLPDGGTKRVASQGQAERAPDDAVIGIFGVIQDISAQAAAEEALRLSEQQYRLLAENATDVVLRTGDDGFVLYASPSCVELSGYLPEELTGRHCGEFIHWDDLDAVHAAHVALITGTQTARTVEYRLRHKSGDWRWLESHMKPWRAPEGDKGVKGGVISAIRDIGRRKELQDELVGARDKAESAVRAKAGFLANMSHEIRTPMNGVLGFTELVLAGDLQSDQRRHVELIAESGRSMMRLLNDILDVSKIDSGKMHVTEEPVDIRHIVRRCADLMKTVVSVKGVVLSTRVDPVVPQRILGDPLRLRQVVLNLIGNAAKFTERGAVTVEVLVEQDTLRIDVVDTGIGIPTERLEMIFDQFTQADNSTARLYGGTGLGLSISGELTNLMGGAITVRSVVGEGTTFTVRLPLRIIEGEVASVEIDAATTAIAPEVVRKPRVLIAEDHDINQELIMAMAHRAGMEPMLAVNGAEAITMVVSAAKSGQPFELVLMDMQMPEVDGLEATRRLRQAGYTSEALPIVALTANAYAEDIQSCLAAGMQAHLAKPVRVRDLTAILARFVVADTPMRIETPKVSTKLLDRYRTRKMDTLRKLDDLSRVDRPTHEAIMEAADLLHKLAGVAAMFGEAKLGECAKRLEDDFLACPADQHASVVEAAAVALRQVA